MEIKVTRNTKMGTMPPADKLGFGTVFTDHMFLMDYDSEKGWYDPRIVPFGPLNLSPAANVFHYAAEVFEGLKAYRREDGCVQLFRPMENMNRFKNSAMRMGLPYVDPQMALEAVDALVTMEQDWVPSEPGTSLYVRPFIFATDANLGLHGIKEAVFCIILSPVGSYFKEGLAPVKIMLETEDVRAVKGGTGFAKCGGNYAASNRANERAEDMGFSQVLWLDGVHRKYVEEVGSMNVMFLINDTVVTPELSGSVLPGITRKSCIEMLKDWGYKVEERLLSVDELFDAAKTGALKEAWGAGTAAVISPIGELNFKGTAYKINNSEIGQLSQRLYDELTGIQWGKLEDTYGWVYPIKNK